MSDEDILREVAEGEVDVFLTPRLQPVDSPQHSSGVSSQSSHSVPGVPSPAVPLPAAPLRLGKSSFPCPYDTCKNKKPYKTKIGYEKHIFVHQITDYNSRKPDLEGIAGAVGTILKDIVCEIKEESGSSELKVKIMEGIQQSYESLDWPNFVQSLSEPILKMLTKRTKLLPTNQYEEFLSNLNHLMNSPGFFPNLRAKLLVILSNWAIEDSPTIGMILYRMCTRLADELQTLILKNMSKSTVQHQSGEAASALQDPMSQEDENLFSDKISTIIRTYYSKAMTINTEVWVVRCKCIRRKFISSVDGSSPKTHDIVKKSLWQDGHFTPHSEILDFCKGVERVIKIEFLDCSKVLTSDAVVIFLLDTPSNDVVKKWHLLTSGYFSEVDCIVFMRDFVSILVNLSLRLEQSKLKRAEESGQRLQRFALRDDLKRN